MEDTVSHNDLSKLTFKLKSKWDIVSHTYSDFEVSTFNKGERDFFFYNQQHLLPEFKFINGNWNTFSMWLMEKETYDHCYSHY